MTAPATEQVITLQMKPRQAILLNMMWGLSAAVLCGDSAAARRIADSLHAYTLRYRREFPGEAQEITLKVSNIRNAFSDDQLRAMNITNYKLDTATGEWSKERP
jgi:hypothetical protein